MGAESIKRAEDRLRCEQAVRGLDALDELGIQSLLVEGFGEAGWGVLREVVYPTPPSRRARRAERDRCDIVLTEAPGVTLVDAVEVARAQDEREATLFAGVMAPGVPTGADPREAVWIEVKTLGQFACVDGVPRPNRSYATELVRGAAIDARKLASDPLIERGFAVVVLFAASVSVAYHDLGVAAHRLLDLGAPITAPAWEIAPIADRIGNCVCAVWATGVRSER